MTLAGEEFYEASDSHIVKQVKWTEKGTLITSTEGGTHTFYDSLLKKKGSLQECGPTYEFDTFTEED